MNRDNIIILVSGAARSGKSKYAEQLIKDRDKVIYLATFRNNIKDYNWNERIEKHKRRRPKEWGLLENYEDINREIASIKNENTLLIDSVGGIVYQELQTSCQKWDEFTKAFIKTLKSFRGMIVLVIEEVGWGISPIDEESNVFIDRIGEFTENLEAIAQESYLIIHGNPINLKRHI